MTGITYAALTTVAGEDAAARLGSAMERLDPAPTGVGVFEIEDGSGLWEIGGYFDAAPDGTALALLSAMSGAATFAVSRIEPQDWVAQVQRELSPVDAGRFTVHGRHDAHRVGAHRIGLRIEAAMAFGTGHHGTTRGCLELIDGLARRGWNPRRVADIGCGTGVLAMAAARLWQCRAIASDIDPVAAWTARENLAANGAGRVGVLCAPGFRHPGLRAHGLNDLVLANILAAPLKRLAPDIARHVTPGGYAVLSGLLTSQAAGVEAVFRGHGFVRTGSVTHDPWRSLLLRRIRSGAGPADLPRARGNVRS